MLVIIGLITLGNDIRLIREISNGCLFDVQSFKSNASILLLE